MASERFMKKNYGASGFVRAPDVLGATAEAVQDSLREDVALAFKLCNQQAATIAALEARLKALEWTLITESNLPNRGDEVLQLPTSTHGAKVIPVGFDSREGDQPRYVEAGFTHRRPINAPIPPPTEGSVTR